jgi:hypothetical protein
MTNSGLSGAEETGRVAMEESVLQEWKKINVNKCKNEGYMYVKKW